MSPKNQFFFVILLCLSIVSAATEDEEGCGCGSDSLTRNSFEQTVGEPSKLEQNSCENQVQKTQDSVSKMSTRLIREELKRRDISVKDLTKNDEYVKALVDARVRATTKEFKEEMIFVPGGAFIMGTNKPAPYPGDGEGPPRIIALSDFLLDKDAVTNAQFSEFVRNTGYETESEKFGWSFVFNMSLSKETMEIITQAVEGVPWWLPVNGATWRFPEGPHGDDVMELTSNNPSSSYPGGRLDHAVVHVSWSDAQAYCQWRNQSRLPTEAEWEYAMKYVDQGVSFRTLYPWGDEAEPTEGPSRMNIWQGNFPITNDVNDGWRFTCPSDAYEPQTALGFRNMLGNVWEWVEDWWGTDHKEVLGDLLRSGQTTEISVVSDPNTMESVNRTVVLNPQGPSTGTEKAKRGGSFLCHASFCYRYRPNARHKNTPDSATSNNGFRCAKSIQ